MGMHFLGDNRYMENYTQTPLAKRFELLFNKEITPEEYESLLLEDKDIQKILEDDIFFDILKKSKNASLRGLKLLL